jgi:hypothetical protein
MVITSLLTHSTRQTKPDTDPGEFLQQEAEVLTSFVADD